ncbi:NAD(P)-binding Rossmann-fold superfamily protein [Artemisia annua]|uniref:NAD(P)-binding Rossmann-fold superfamily protein n=1 Tax=Artemisia annua TaxID=35608 RepID=A0A2U1MC86_ARTAN|nr:NAD(P)-binding Rossmann-fold superfamily protein [Artemisia annua]
MSSQGLTQTNTVNYSSGPAFLASLIFSPVDFNNSEMWFAETIAVVTGANRKIGFETTHKLATQGITIILISREVAVGEESSKVSIDSCAPAMHQLYGVSYAPAGSVPKGIPQCLLRPNTWSPGAYKNQTIIRESYEHVETLIFNPLAIDRIVIILYQPHAIGNPS